MNALAFDTLKAAKASRDAGFDEAQTEAVVTTVGGAISEQIATKTDIAELRADIYRHLWPMAAGIIGVTVTLVKAIRG